MNTLHTTVHIGLKNPFSVIHVTDTHLTLADERDDERKNKLAVRRRRVFPEADEILAEVEKRAKETGLPIVFTGDLLDFVSEANLDRAREFINRCDCFFAAGNHEFSLYVGEAWEDAEYRNRSLAKVQSAFSNDIRASSRVIGGVNFVALDNGYYLFEEEQLDFLKCEAARGLPIVLLMHTPLYEPTLFDIRVNRREEYGLPPQIPPCAYLLGVPEELMGDYDDHRFRQQKADECTRRTYEYILSEPLIRAAVTGHLHSDYEGTLPSGIPQIITSDTTIRIITFT